MLCLTGRCSLKVNSLFGSVKGTQYHGSCRGKTGTSPLAAASVWLGRPEARIWRGGATPGKRPTLFAVFLISPPLGSEERMVGEQIIAPHAL